MKLDGGRQCHSTGVCLKDIIGLEGVELGADGKVGMLQFLFPYILFYKGKKWPNE